MPYKDGIKAIFVDSLETNRPELSLYDEEEYPPTVLIDNSIAFRIERIPGSLIPYLTARRCRSSTRTASRTVWTPPGKPCSPTEMPGKFTRTCLPCRPRQGCCGPLELRRILLPAGVGG